jgi:hypothetical protein
LNAFKIREDVVKKLLLAAAAGVCMAACAEAPTAPSTPKSVAPSKANADDLECRSGYVIAFDENGNPVCVLAEPDSPNGSSTSSSVRIRP